MKDYIIKEVMDFVNSYKDSLTHRVLLGKSANIFKLINNAVKKRDEEELEFLNNLDYESYSLCKEQVEERIKKLKEVK